MNKKAPKCWNLVNFDSFFTVLPSKKYQVQKQEYLEKGLVPVVDQGQKLIIGYTDHESKKFNKNKVIVFGDHTRNVKYIDFEFAVGADGTQILETKDGIDLKFGYYQLLNKKIPDTGYNRHFKYVKAEKYTIPPTLEEQQEIVQVLDTMSDIIRLREECISHAQALIPALFQEMFGDINNNVTKSNIVRFRDCIELNPAKPNLKDNLNVTFLGMKDISENGQVDLSTIKMYEEVKKGFTNFENEDVLLAKITPCFENGKAAIVRNLINGYGFGSTEFYVLRPHRKLILPEYVYSIIKSHSFAEPGKYKMVGAAGQKRLPKEYVLNYKFPLPSIEMQERFAEKVREINSYIEEQQEELKNAKQMFQSLLHHAFTGELTRRAYGEN